MAMRRMLEVFGLDEMDVTAGYPLCSGGFAIQKMLLKTHGHVVKTRATEFLTIDDLAVSPSANWALGQLSGGSDIYIRFQINSTYYFINVDGGDSPGIPGLISPYPEAIVSKTFRLRPEIYVLPGQNFEVEIVHGKLEFAPDNPCKKIFGCMNYIQYDGTDAVIACKLLEMGIRVTPCAIDSYKRTVLSTGSPVSLSTSAIDGDMLTELKDEILSELKKERELRKVRVAESIDEAVQKAVRKEMEKTWD